LPGGFCRRLLPKAFGPEFGEGLQKLLDERFSEERESRCRRVERTQRNDVRGADLKVYAAGLVEAHTTRQERRRDVLRKVARNVCDVRV
jgi:hypothetical protein